MGGLCEGPQWQGGRLGPGIFLQQGCVLPTALVPWGFPLTLMELLIFTNHRLLKLDLKMLLVWVFSLLLWIYFDWNKVNPRYLASFPGRTVPLLLERSVNLIAGRRELSVSCLWGRPFVFSCLVKRWWTRPSHFLFPSLKPLCLSDKGPHGCHETVFWHTK